MIRQLLVESLVLAAVGGALGVALAMAIDQALIDFLPSGHTPLSLTSTPDWPVLAFTFAISLIAGAVFGLVPALQSTRPKLGDHVEGSGGRRDSRRFGGAAQGLGGGAGFALAAAADWRGAVPAEPAQSEDAESGLRGEESDCIRCRSYLNPRRPGWVADYYRRLRERLSALPGVESHAAAVIPVLADNEWDNWVTIEGYSAKQDERPDPHMQYCTPGFFKTLKIPVLLGRDFNERDGIKRRRWAL